MVRAIVELCKAFRKQREVTNSMEQVEITFESHLKNEKDLTCGERHRDNSKCKEMLETPKEGAKGNRVH